MESALQTSQIIINVVVLLILAVVMVGIFILIKYLKHVSAKFEVLNENLGKYMHEFTPIINKTSVFLDHSNSIISKVDSNVKILSAAVENIKGVSDDIVQFQRTVRSKIEPPIIDTITSYAAIVKGIRAFIDNFRSFRASDKKVYDDEYEFDNDEDELYGKVNSNNASSFSNEIHREMEDLNKELNEVRKKIDELKK